MTFPDILSNCPPCFQQIVETARNKRPDASQSSQNVPITFLPAELLTYIFSFCEKVGHIHALLLVSKYWKQIVENMPRWQQFKRHFLRLHCLYPDLSLTDRKKVFEAQNLVSFFDLGERCSKLFHSTPKLCLEQAGRIVNIKSTAPFERRSLCVVDDTLQILDLEDNTLHPFPLREYWDEKQPPLPSITDENKFSLEWVNGSYLVIREGKLPTLTIARKNQPPLIFQVPPGIEPQDHVQESLLILKVYVWNKKYLIVQAMRSYEGANEEALPPNTFPLFLIDCEAGQWKCLQNVDTQNNRLRIFPSVVVGEKWFAWSLPLQRVSYFYNGSVHVLPEQEPMEMNRFLVGSSEGSFYTAKGSFSSQATDFFLYRHFFNAEGALNTQEIAIEESKRQIFAKNLESFLSNTQLFSHHLAVTTFNAAGEICVGNIQRQQLFHQVTKGKDQFDRICQTHLVSDYLILAGEKQQGKIQFFGTLLGSSTSLQPIAISIENSDHFHHFKVYNETLVIQNQSQFKVYQFVETPTKKITSVWCTLC